jgi:ankyrin repeat protein
VDRVDDSGWTALSRASKWGKLDVVKLLLNKGADVNIADESGSNALQRAIEYGDPKVVELLTQASSGVDIDSGPSYPSAELVSSGSSDNDSSGET